MGGSIEPIQCLINIFNNTIFAFNEKNMQSKLIFITTSNLKNNVIIIVKDSGGGMISKIKKKN